MSDENKSRRCSFELFPDERTGDKIADELIANEKLKERGRFMRAMLVTGAAFAAIDKRLPLLISELLTENTTLDDINKVISSVIPGAFSVEKKLLELLEKQSGLHTSHFPFHLPFRGGSSPRKQSTRSAPRLQWRVVPCAGGPDNEAGLFFPDFGSAADYCMEKDIPYRTSGSI
ncbi:plasmid partitioning/stability family protein (plasmid) [Escherichia coli]|nr:plasmid partitioning/stability family protein [Escherichia coli]